MLKKLLTPPDGKMYQIGRVADANPLQVVIIRNDWLKKLNLSMPTTPDELFNVARAFTENDPDGNGKKDTFGFAFSKWNGLIVDNMYGVAGTGDQNGNIALYEKNGTLERDWARIQACSQVH